MDNMDRTAVGMTSFRRLRHVLLERKDDYDLKQQDFAVVDIKVSDFKNYMDAYGEVFCQCLMEEAARHYRAIGRKVLRLTVARDNPAVGFYRKTGFRHTGWEPGALEDLMVMEKKL